MSEPHSLVKLLPNIYPVSLNGEQKEAKADELFECP